MTPKTPSTEQLQIEKILLPRLKVMGYLLFVCCLASLLTGIFLESSTESPPPPATTTRLSPLERSLPPSFFLDDTSEEIDLNAAEVLNFYFISAVFACVGTLCVLYAHKNLKNIYT